MTDIRIQGVIPPIITTFDSRGNFDSKRYTEFVSILSDKVQGLFVCGTYGSGPMMTTRERMEVLETAVDAAGTKIPVIAHVGSSVVSDIFELSIHAQQTGAVAVAAVPPFYFNYSQSDIIRLFGQLMEQVEVPVYIYNNPKTSGHSVDIETLAELKKMGLSGIKDSTFDLLYFYSLLDEVGLDDFTYISGTEAFIIPTVTLGASGAICGLANAFPEIVVDLYNAVSEDNWAKAFELQQKVNTLRNVQHLAQSITAIHAMLKMRGIDAGVPRKPFAPVDRGVEERIRKRLIEEGML